MFAKAVRMPLQLLTLPGQLQGSLTGFAQQTTGIQNVPALPFLLGVSKNLGNRHWCHHVMLVEVHSNAERRSLEGSWLVGQRIVLLIPLANEFRFGKVTHGRRNQLHHLLVAQIGQLRTGMAQQVVAGQQADLVAKGHVIVGGHILASLSARLQVDHALKGDTYELKTTLSDVLNYVGIIALLSTSKNVVCSLSIIFHTHQQFYNNFDSPVK